MQLTPTEQGYIDLMADSPKGVSTAQLLKIQEKPKRQSNIVAVNIKNLRKKGFKIVNVRGWGYKLDVDNSD